MKKVNVTANVAHPIHHLLDELNMSVFQWLVGVRSTEVPKMLRAMTRAMGSVRIAGTGRRQEHHIGNAVESLMWTETGFRVLFQRGLIAADIFDLARRHIDRALKAIEMLGATDSDNWSTVELPPLQKRPDELAESANIRPLILMRARITDEIRALRVREPRTVSDPNTPLKDAA